MKPALPQWAGDILSYAGKRALVGIVLVGSLIVVGWSLTGRLSLITEAHSSIQSAFLLDQELMTLRTKWSGPVQEEIDQEVRQADAQLIQGFEHTVRWLEKVRAQSLKLGFSWEHSLGETLPAPEHLVGVQLLPVKFVLGGETPPGSYEAMIDLLRALDDEQVRVDLQEVMMTGDGNGVQRIVIQVNVWMKHTG